MPKRERERVKSRKTSSRATGTGTFQHIPVTDTDIGGELLPILSKGLYTNPLDCIREYVQNGVDARASEIKIKITGNSVVISDNGIGMDKPELLQARQFGVSRKSLEEYVGFRGIGIYSGFDLSDRLVITTKKEGERTAFVMRFDFQAMKGELERVRNEQGDNSIPLSDLLYRNTDFNQQDWDDAVAHFTVVQLEDINDVHIRRLSNRTELRKYILQNLPVDFDGTFPYRNEITKRLRTNVSGYKAVRLLLQSDDASDEVIAKPSIPELQPPMFGFIENSNEEKIAYYWACLNSNRSRIGDSTTPVADPTRDPREFQGFVYKYKGFTIGNRHKLRPMFTKGSGTLYHWYTGEIYVLDSEVVPNAERDDFETTPAKLSLETAVRTTLSKLEETAAQFQAQGAADEKIERRSQEMSDVEAGLGSGGLDDFDAFSRLEEVRKELKRQRGKASPDKKDIADSLIRKAERLQKQIRYNIDHADTRARRRRKQPLGPTVSDAATTPAIEQRSIKEVITSFSGSASDDLNRVAEIIDLVLIEIIGRDSSTYGRIVNEVEARLQAELSE